MDISRVPAAAMLLLTFIYSTTAIALNTSSSEPAACGGLSIAYPFWLGGTQPPECGYRAFQVTCEDKGTFKNLDISYQPSSFRVTNLQISTCDYDLDVNASSDLSLSPFTISTANQELFFLYNCSLQGRPPPPTWVPMNCTGGSKSDRSASNSFVWLAGAYKPDDIRRPVGGNCSVAMMPVVGYEGAAGADYQRLMKGGFLLGYNAGDCAPCVESSGLPD